MLVHKITRAYLMYTEVPVNFFYQDYLLNSEKNHQQSFCPDNVRKGPGRDVGRKGLPQRRA